jgi:hypothetical protein
MSSERGSMPLALLASIVVAGLVSVLVASVMRSEQTVRFDRSFTNVVQVADAGVHDAVHQLNNQLLLVDIGDTAGPYATTLNDEVANWQIERLSEREFEITSQGTSADGVSRTVIARVEQQSLFFPGAFGDRLVAMNGTSTQIDSYESRTANCAGNTDPDKCWGYGTLAEDFGTGKGALGTNNDFDFSGNVKVLRAILYDWLENPATPSTVTAANPGGDRCKGNPCTAEVLGFEDEKLDYGSDAQMAFIDDKFEACDGVNAAGVSREQGKWLLGDSKNNAPAAVLKPYSTADADNEGSPADPGWGNYYCADSLQIIGDVVLEDASREKPVVIFLRDSYSQAGHTYVNCPGCPANMNQHWRQVRPVAGALQIYVSTEAPSKGANVMIDQHATFAGVVYSPRATCGSSGNAGAHIYGSMICRDIDNVGNWRFHFDTALADYGRGRYAIASWREEPGVSVAAEG